MRSSHDALVRRPIRPLELWSTRGLVGRRRRIASRARRSLTSTRRDAGTGLLVLAQHPRDLGHRGALLVAEPQQHLLADRQRAVACRSADARRCARVSGAFVGERLFRRRIARRHVLECRGIHEPASETRRGSSSARSRSLPSSSVSPRDRSVAMAWSRGQALTLEQPLQRHRRRAEAQGIGRGVPSAPRLRARIQELPGDHGPQERGQAAASLEPTQDGVIAVHEPQVDVAREFLALVAREVVSPARGRGSRCR